MISFPILSIMIFMPLLAGVLCSLVRKENRDNAVRIAIFISILNSIFALVLCVKFDIYNPGFQFVELHNWLPREKIQFSLGVDSISLAFVVLSVLLSTLMIIGTKSSIKDRLREYSIYGLLLQSFMVGSFCSTNLLMFYIFFEAVLIPMFFIIGIWGGENRIYASIKFFLYTLFGSIFLLIGIIKIYIEVGSLEYSDIICCSFSMHLQIMLWLAFFASFAVKIPMWPLHTWLPDAHVEAPAGGSVILAGVLLKMGGYGFLRFSLPFFPDASKLFAPYMLFLSIVAVVWASFIALSQTDIKKLIAYSSVAHMGIVTFGIFTFEPDAIMGSVLQMISHGLVSGALFFCIGMLYDRFHTRDQDLYGGVIKIMPAFSKMFMVFTFASIGLPFTSGFIGEILILINGFKVNYWLTGFACLGMVVGAGYMLSMFRKVFLGKLSKNLGLDNRLLLKDYVAILALKSHEKIVLVILCVIVLVMGIYPQHIMTPIRRTIRQNYTTHIDKKPLRIIKRMKIGV
jgi:NADH-quinone oxidoreductase subunit M